MSEFLDTIRAHLSSVRAANARPRSDRVGHRLTQLIGDEQSLTNQRNELDREIAETRDFIAELEKDLARKRSEKRDLTTILLGVTAEIRSIRERALAEGDDD